VIIYKVLAIIVILTLFPFHSHCIHYCFTEEHLKEKVPELEKSLSLVQSLIEKQENQITNGVVRYNLVDSIYAKAEIDYTIGIVYLWLGANVMLEYTYDEAIQFLQTNYTRATTELQHVNIDLSFIRDQIVTTEVNISRIYNWDVRQKRNTTTANPTSTTGTA
jgi:prefoldin subunit 5